jgi:hypothetical protein
MLTLINVPLFNIPSNLSAFLKYSRAVGFKGLPAFDGAADKYTFEPRTHKSVFC